MTVKFLRGFVDRMLYRQPPGGWEQDLWYVGVGALRYIYLRGSRLPSALVLSPLQEQIHCALAVGQWTRTGPALPSGAGRVVYERRCVQRPGRKGPAPE